MRNKVYDIVEKEEPIGRDELIKKANYGKRGGEALINVITALGLLKCIDKKYYLTEQSKIFLTHSSAFSWKAMLVSKSQKALEALERENFLNTVHVGNWSEGKTESDERAVQFTEFMQSQHLSAANDLAVKVDLRKKFGVNSLIDVAGGSGCFA